MASSRGSMSRRADSLPSGTWRICDQTGVRGQRLVENDDGRDVDVLGMRNRIRSARRWSGRQG
jgi:hypothetical protein